MRWPAISEAEARRQGMSLTGRLYGFPIYARHVVVHDCESYHILGRYVGSLLILEVLTFLHCCFVWFAANNPEFVIPVKELEVIK
jgi:hypothetical protein